MHDTTKNGNYGTTSQQHAVIGPAKRGGCEESAKARDGGGEVSERKANNEQGKHLTQCERREPAEEAGCPPKLSHILDFRELTTGEEKGGATYHTYTQACPSFVHPSSLAYPSRKEHVHRHLCLSRCCKHWTREMAVRTLEKKTLGKKTLHGRKHGRWLQTRACPSCLCHHSITTSLSHILNCLFPFIPYIPLLSLL